MDADTASFGSEDATPGSGACLSVRAFLAGSGGPAFWARFGVPHLFLWPFLLLSFSARPPQGLGCPACVFSGFFSPLVRPPCLRRSVFSGPGCLGPWRLVVLPPPLFCFFSSPPLRVGLFVLVSFSGVSSFLPLFFLSCSAGCAVPGWCVVVCGVCWCVLLWALCFGGGRCALALCCSVPLACASLFVLLPVLLCVLVGAVLAALLFPLWCCPLHPSGAWRGGVFFCVGFVLVVPPCLRRLAALSCVMVCRSSCGVVLRSVVCLVLLCGVLVFLRCVVLGRVVLLLLCFAVVRFCVLC